MAAFRRIVIGSMGDELYDKLGTDPNGDKAWSLVRDLVGQQLFGNEFVTVPHLSSSAYYNQLFVFIKKRDIMERLGFRSPTYKLVGNLDYLVNRDFSTWVPQFDFSSWDVADGLNMYREYRFRVSSEAGSVPEKLVEIIVKEAHARSAQPPAPGSLVIHKNLVQDLNNIKTMYVITDVVLASFIRVAVRIGQDQKVIILDHDTPIGFRYQKYQVGLDGTITRELYTRLKYKEREARWLIPRNQPIPRMPGWDPMRRVYGQERCRRKKRNNLTIHTPEEGPRRQTRVTQQFISSNSPSTLRFRMVDGTVPNGILNTEMNEYPLRRMPINLQNTRGQREIRSLSYDNLYRSNDNNRGSIRLQTLPPAPDRADSLPQVM